MSISTDTITAIFDRHDVQHEYRQDPELLGAAYALAFLEEPDGGAEQRFYDARTTLPGDTPDELSYEMPNRAMLTEIYDDRILRRSHILEMEDLMAEADPTRS
ncbi:MULTISPECIES: hypothetical protein [unclassified Arthrobacter]|jgi:hypothetical protein|uniref:hypothetical protein n=1 Tax=Micrococcaceae TaxID=1268 RepID=UPI001CC5FB7D|nr:MULTISPECIES: hypothetical protein [unclassified Arthrobacter]BCW77884.1 hypothetical protein NicSoilB11_42090 [Arthrobacter sp. NicSoilB11]GIU58027.1 hypothetical protein NicSoilC12_37760 [Arthrobacter sp. NicSoilC12]